MERWNSERKNSRNSVDAAARVFDGLVDRLNMIEQVKRISIVILRCHLVTFSQSSTCSYALQASRMFPRTILNWFLTSLSNHQQTTECKVDAIRDLAQEETIRNLVWQVQMTISAFLHANLLKIPISRHADSSWREFISNFWQALGQPSDYISGPM